MRPEPSIAELVAGARQALVALNAEHASAVRPVSGIPNDGVCVELFDWTEETATQRVDEAYNALRKAMPGLDVYGYFLVMPGVRAAAVSPVVTATAPRGARPGANAWTLSAPIALDHFAGRSVHLHGRWANAARVEAKGTLGFDLGSLMAFEGFPSRLVQGVAGPSLHTVPAYMVARGAVAQLALAQAFLWCASTTWPMQTGSAVVLDPFVGWGVGHLATTLGVATYFKAQRPPPSRMELAYGSRAGTEPAALANYAVAA